MPTIDDLQVKLNNAQEKFNNIVNELSSFSSLKKTLDSSDKGIKMLLQILMHLLRF